jgi:intracellular multiplication protein IcmO
MAIETYASGLPHVARRDSLAALAERDRSRELPPKVNRPITMSGLEFLATINQLSKRLAA